ncbi:MAG: hypothetical protein M1818_008105 [Claussenomyces sp. TS43310]|nr:MAG: hypothetical protein M1818_008105 [Claussenomyces sp. TS43310]
MRPPPPPPPRCFGLALAAAACAITTVKADVFVNGHDNKLGSNDLTFAASEIVTMSWNGITSWSALFYSLEGGSVTPLFVKAAAPTSGTIPALTANSPLIVKAAAPTSETIPGPESTASSPASLSTCTPYGVQSPSSRGCYYPSVTAASTNVDAGFAILAMTYPVDQSQNFFIVSQPNQPPGSDNTFGPFSVGPPSSTSSPISTLSPISGTITSSTGVQSSSTPISSSTTSSSPTSLSAIAPESKSHLSAGAKAGIAVGVLVGVLAVLGAAFFLWRRRRQQKRSAVAGAGYDQALNATDRALHPQKEMDVINTDGTGYAPVDHHNISYDGIPPVTAHTAPGSSHWTDDHDGAEAVSVTEEQYHDTPAEQAQQAVPSHRPPQASMSAEERVRWDQEEAQIDEAIAAAESRR